jgi:hypothetical protein
MIGGGCFCGSVRYEISDGGAFNETICHCSICRRTTGAPFVAWFTVKRADLRLVRGTLTRLRSTPAAVRSFCPLCGTQIAFENSALPDEIDVTTCSLDDPHRVPPTDHTFIADKVAWVKLCDGLPQHPAKRDDAGE